MKTHAVLFALFGIGVLAVPCIASACDVDARLGRASVGSGGDGTIDITVSGHCPSGNCQVEVEYEVVYTHTMNNNGFPLNTNGVEKSTGYIEIEEEGGFHERFESDFALRACVMGAECDVVSSKLRDASCEG